MRNIRYYTRKIINVIKWLPVIWKLWGDDYGDILRLLDKQFADMEDSYINHGTTVSAPVYGSQVRMARLLVKRMQAQEYTNMGWDYVETGPDFFDYEFVRRPMVPKQEFWDYERDMQRQDLDCLCKIINKNFYYWWD